MAESTCRPLPNAEAGLLILIIDAPVDGVDIIQVPITGPPPDLPTTVNNCSVSFNTNTSSPVLLITTWNIISYTLFGCNKNWVLLPDTR